MITFCRLKDVHLKPEKRINSLRKCLSINGGAPIIAARHTTQTLHTHFYMATHSHARVFVFISVCVCLCVFGERGARSRYPAPR